MPTLHFAGVARCMLVIAALAPSSLLAQTDAAPAGVEWQTTSQISMEGMPAGFGPPPRPVKVCARADAVEPPGSADEERGCVNSEFAREDLTVTWTSVCAGPPAMNGSGTITYADEARTSYTGAITYATEEGTVIINLTGERIGTCDNPR